MSAKESKAILKEVREAIKNQKYAEAIEKCESLLKNEPKNHMIYLLLGAAYQNSNKAEAAKYLRKAVEYAPAAPTIALQGLANCAPLEELPKIYEQLLDLVPEKYQDYYEKLFATAESIKAAPECFDVFKREARKFNDARQKYALKYLGCIWLANDFEVNPEEEALYKNSLQVILEDAQNAAQQMNAYKRYLKLLYKQKDLKNCIKYACAAVERDASAIFAFEWICKVYCENYHASANVEWRAELKMPIAHYAQALLALNKTSSLALLIKAIELYALQQYVDARENSKKALQIQPNYAVAIELLARIEMQLGAYELALPMWQQLQQMQSVEYAICLSHADDDEKLRVAVNVLSQATSRTAETTNALARCLHKLHDFEQLRTLELDVLTQAEYLSEPETAIKLLEIGTNLETFAALLLYGKLQYALGNYGNALNCMLKATRLQPHRAECFCILGQIYNATNDLVRARKCFEKCVHLNPLCEQAVHNLNAIYQQLNDEEANCALLLNTLKYMKTERSKGVHYKLGLHYLHVNKWDDAIQEFRTAIKYDATAMIYWESLGDAYAGRGSYNSAIRVFQKISEMQPDNIYAKLQIALIKTTIRMYAEAIEDFENLLQAHVDYLPGLKGAAEAHIGLANNLRQEHRYGRCKTHLQFAVNHLQRAFLTLRNHDMVWLWRLTAHVFVQTAQMPTSMADLNVAGKLAKRGAETVNLQRKDLLHLAIRFYTCALNLRQNTFLWYELALCCYLCAECLPEEAQLHLHLALKACKKAIQEQSNRWQNWNLLGLIHMQKTIKNLPLAQHCFIQALNLERKSFTTWTNLGVLYLQLNEIKLANQAFQRAQQSSPIYANAWIGQAMIAEAIHEEEEALDLFRHCQQFEFNPESALGYAHWVCTILSDLEKCQQPHYKHAIENMFADVVALDAINWYSAYEECDTSAAALSYQGFLNQRQNLNNIAVKAYILAVEKTESAPARDKLLTNLGYLYLKLNEPQLAINAFNTVTQASFKPIIGLALAYFRADEHQEAYAVYNSVLKSVAGIEDDKAARILVAMASMVYASQGEADTKTILYQCILLKDSPIQALYSACALGILHHDNQLTETILMELKKYEKRVEHCAHIAFLNAQYYLSNQQIRKALSYLISRVHIFPHCAELRKVLANFLLEHYSQTRQFHTPTAQIALSAIDLVHRSKAKKSNCIEDAQLLILASRALRPVHEQRSLKLIQRAIHLHPQNKNAWQALLQVH